MLTSPHVDIPSMWAIGEYQVALTHPVIHG